MILRNFCLLAMLSFLSLGAYAMGGKIMFSSVKGQIVQNGKPVAGAKVVRQYVWQWNGKKVIEETTSDGSGNFSFKQASQSSLLTSIVPHEPVITQLILIHFADKKYEAWSFSKRNYDDMGELRRPIEIICDLDTKPDNYFKDAEFVYGICKPK